MKQSIKFLTFSFIAVAMLAFANIAHAGFNENIAGTDCSPSFGIAISGQPLQDGCASYRSSISAGAGQSVDVRLYYRNTSTQDATNVTAGIIPTSSGNFTAFLNSSVGSINGSANLSMPSNSALEFNGAKIYQRQGTTTPIVVKEIRTLSELRSFSMQTIPSYTKCTTSGNSFCYQGIIVATFSIVQNATPTTYICSNGIDDDGDGLVDMQDPGCTSPQDNDEYNYVQPVSQCVINNFNASPNQIYQGGSSVLNWSTSNCNSVQIYPNVNSVNVTGSQSVFPTNSTVYTLYAYGTNGSPTATTTVNVVANQPQICYDTNAQNYGGSLPCIAKPVVTVSGPSVSTSAATSITSSSCRLNSIVNISSSNLTSGYFKYGTSSSNLNFTTIKDTVGTNSGNYQFADTLTGLKPSTTYYYKAVVTNSYGTKEGETRSCTTRSNTVVVNEPSAPVTRTVVRPITTVVVPEERIIANSAPSLLFLRIDDRREDLTCNDVVDYQVVYKNISNVVLEKAILEVNLPAGLVYVKSSAGGTFSPATNTVTFNIGTILPNQEDAKFIQADVNCKIVDSQMLVADASIVYTNTQTTAQEEAVAYDLDRFFNGVAVNNTNLTGAAIFGIGFFPDSLIGWLILILVILGLIYLVRVLMPLNSSKRTSVTEINKNGTSKTTTVNTSTDVI